MDENTVLKQIINSGILDDKIDDKINKKFDELYTPYIKGKKWYSTQEAATYLKRKPATIGNYTSEGKLKFVRVGKNRQFDIDELNRFRESLIKQISH